MEGTQETLGAPASNMNPYKSQSPAEKANQDYQNMQSSIAYDDIHPSIPNNNETSGQETSHFTTRKTSYNLTFRPKEIDSSFKNPYHRKPNLSSITQI